MVPPVAQAHDQWYNYLRLDQTGWTVTLRDGLHLVVLSLQVHGYCKPTFIRALEHFIWFARTSTSRILLVANQTFYAVPYERRLDRKNYSPLASL
jgi:hypothetical protein